MKDFKYLVVQDYILKQIQNKQLKPGMKIMSERKLSEQLNINRMTVKNAINKLVDSNILYRVHGKGTYVTESQNHNGRLVISEKTPISLKMKNIILGKITYNDVMSFKVLYDNNYFSNIFGYDKDFYELVRVRYSDEVPYSIEFCYFPFRKFIDAIRYDFSKISLYDYMDYKRNLPIKFKTRMAVVKEPSIAIALNLNKDASLFKVEFYGKSEAEELVEFTKSYILLHKVEFNYHISKNK